MNDWKDFADAASVDIAAARDQSTGPKEALDHLRDAQNNIWNAIDALEDALETE